MTVCHDELSSLVGKNNNIVSFESAAIFSYLTHLAYLWRLFQDHHFLFRMRKIFDTLRWDERTARVMRKYEVFRQPST